LKKLIILAFVLLFANTVWASELTICKGKYALCAASTCVATGNKIHTNDGNTYDEVDCKCPVLDGASIADTSAGVMNGSCDVKNPNVEVWSLFAPKVYYPQAANGFVNTPKGATRATVQKCSADLASESTNCWGMICRYDKDPTNGTVTATCHCPIGQITGVEFLTEAGQGDPSACDEHPVAAPAPATQKKIKALLAK
jgi:hypothetical protein